MAKPWIIRDQKSVLKVKELDIKNMLIPYCQCGFSVKLIFIFRYVT